MMSHWSELKESGTVKGLLLLFWLHRYLGRAFFNIVLYPVTAYYFLTNSVARRSSIEFLLQHAKHFPEQWSRTPNYLDVFKHLYCFGQCILDKSLGWNDNISEDQFCVKNRAVLDRFTNKKHGQLIIGSHFGNLEFCRGFVNRFRDIVINVLVYDLHSANFVTAMQKLNPRFSMKVYQVSDLDISLTLQLKAKVDSGEWLFIAGDRVPLSGDIRTVEVDFLGRKTKMPMGPYILAKVLQCEVHLMFSYRDGKSIKFDVIEFADQVTITRGDGGASLHRYAQAYALALQEQVKEAPLQWFNFYPYWPGELVEQGVDVRA